MENRKREKGAPFIEIKDLSYAYPGEEGRGQQVLSHINLTIREGEYTVILGHNGSGKSTLAKLINLVIDDYTYAEGPCWIRWGGAKCSPRWKSSTVRKG